MQGINHDHSTNTPCVVCGSKDTWRGGSQKKTCSWPCEQKLMSIHTAGSKNPMYIKGHPKCRDCDKGLSRYKPQKGRKYEYKGRCRTCHNKNKTNIDERTRLNRYVRHIMRSATRAQILHGSSFAKYSKYIGCSAEDFRLHIEKQFWPHMSWDNYGYRGWHIDHIRPLASFDLTNEEEKYKAFHYSNLQPLWWFMNMSKSAKMPGDHKHSPVNLKCGHAGELLYFLLSDKENRTCKGYRIETK